VCARRGRFEEALTLTERARAATPWVNAVQGQLAALLRLTGDRSRADALISKLASSDAPGAAAGLAVYHAMCGEFDRAAEWAGRAIEERYPPLIQTLRPLLSGSVVWPALAKRMKVAE
jgi:hypothetical protein